MDCGTRWTCGAWVTPTEFRLRRCPQTADEDALDREEDDEGGQGDEESTGEGNWGTGARELTLEGGQRGHDRTDVVAAGEGQTEQEVVPDPGELEDEDGCEGVEGERHEDVAEDRQRGGAVEASGLAEVGGNRGEVVADDECGEGDGDRGVEEEESLVGIVEVPLHEHGVER